MELLVAENLRKIYHERRSLTPCTALDGISFTVSEGEFVSIMGPSGSGKTTLLNILASLDAPTSGDVRLDGKSFSEVPEKGLASFRRENLGFVFQDFNLLDTFTLRDNILLPLVLGRRAVSEMEARLAPIAERMGISELLCKYPYEVSGGQKQRAAAARALITDPRLLLADEPTGALDSRASARLLETFADLNAAGKTILMVTHSAMAASYSKRVLFIRDGRLFAELRRGVEDRRVFFDRIVTNLTLLGGADVG